MTISEIWQRFLSDCRDLRRLLTGEALGSVSDGDVERLSVALAKATYIEDKCDWVSWEAVQYAANKLAFWFAPDRYAGTNYNWPVPSGGDNPQAYHQASLQSMGMGRSQAAMAQMALNQMQTAQMGLHNSFAGNSLGALLNPYSTFRISQL